MSNQWVATALAAKEGINQRFLRGSAVVRLAGGAVSWMAPLPHAGRIAMKEHATASLINHEVLGYEKALTESGGGGKGRLAKTLTWTTAVINVPVIKDHDLAGVTCAIKNMVCGNVERPPLMHQRIHTALPHFYALEAIRGRVRLIICDGSFCMYDGGPQYHPGAIVSHDCVYATTDPVAMDAVALDVVDGLRVKNRLRTLEQSKRPATFIRVAEELGLGVADRSQIHLETIELPAFVPA